MVVYYGAVLKIRRQRVPDCSSRVWGQSWRPDKEYLIVVAVYAVSLGDPVFQQQLYTQIPLYLMADTAPVSSD